MQNNEGENNENNKKQRKSNKEEWKCLDCKKSYRSYPAFYTHNKLKHDGKPPQHYDIPIPLDDIRKNLGRPPKKTNSSQNTNKNDKYQQQCEDNIYEFIGKLNQKFISQESNKFTIIRDYLIRQIDPVQSFPLEILLNNQNVQKHAQNIQQQLIIITEELKKSDGWEFIDPLELKPDDMTEFSIYNLKSLFFNLKERNMVTIYTTLVVFLVWISNELLDFTYKEIAIITINYCVPFWELIQNPTLNNNDDTKIQNENNIFKQRQQLKENFFNSLDQLYSNYNFTIFEDQTDLKTFIDSFLLWYYHFDDKYNFLQMQSDQQTLQKQQQQEESTDLKSNILQQINEPCYQESINQQQSQKPQQQQNNQTNDIQQMLYNQQLASQQQWYEQVFIQEHYQNCKPQQQYQQQQLFDSQTLQDLFPK